jgi:hypothetical protein
MGLDTVELVMSFERYFNLEIPDAVSESIHTVGEVITWFSKQLGVAEQRHSTVRVAVAEQLLSELPPGAAEATSLRQVLPDAAALKTCRHALRERYNLILLPLSSLRTAPTALSL